MNINEKMNLIKKIALILFIGVAGNLCAQEIKVESQQKPIISLFPDKGTVMVEVNFKPFGNEEVISIDNFKAKYFIEDNIALRLGVKINSKLNKQTKKDWDASEEYPVFANESSFYSELTPGIEYHFMKDRKISPYLGFELYSGQKKSSASYEYYERAYNSSTGNYDQVYVKESIQNGWVGIVPTTYISNGITYNNYVRSYSAERAFTSFGSNLLFGSDFYFVKNMYFGFELGLGYHYTKNSQITVDVSNQVEKLHMPSYTSSNINFYYNNAIRLGIWF